MTNLTVQEFYERMKDRLKLTLLNPSVPLTRRIRSSEIHRPGLAFSGFYEYFAYDCVQVLGKTEIKFLQKLKGAKRRRNLLRFFSYRIPCIVIAKNQRPPDDFIKMATEVQVPIFRAIYRTSVCGSQITLFVDHATAPETSIHGTMLDVYGIGMLLIGESGIGKSECALELVERGHRLVADDVVKIRREGDVLIGSSNEIVQHHMEIRGLGIIDVQSTFGVGAVRDRKRIVLIVTLESWKSKREYDRLGLETQTKEILGIPLPNFVIPVRPGRNIPILVEAAALTQRAKFMGHHSARDFNDALIDRMQREAGRKF
ncbi:MAG: HPr(Ser) kinase/phosphatase [Candidatus Omnitrophica bacterium CG11_big_fil_rev_8_21_14_0_20_45_26]|uniref:HPr kinase/phosphorylase n=1 Tax=Candidatus Abzuiibacterium crystallinum TaxID=1974748 RepID=A0A2H0LQC2_9BACT|nr:MAG: HPr(Ser) kinase/phosphatase [Candidatus Omnitrophica bacterium CG11_big_fil_rev_8_21_14_0_20_45_26]PIW65211.1 MAG: HPr(Ser) kinase/phosphatase [Candidatus Omnitrophica bacterium CG12_big_fil_rev_8_21_14_0_65_45_16]